MAPPRRPPAGSDDARVQAPRPEEDEVRRRDGVERIGERLRVRRQKLNVVDAAVLLLFEAEDIALADNVAPFSKVAVNRTSVVVTGMTVPLMASTCPCCAPPRQTSR